MRSTKHVFAAVRDIEETILVLLLFINRGHERCWGSGIAVFLYTVVQLEHNIETAALLSISYSLSDTRILPVGGRTLLTIRKSALSAGSSILFRITYTNCPTVKSAGTKYFFLSMFGTFVLFAFSQITGMRSLYLSRMRFVSATRLSVNIFPCS